MSVRRGLRERGGDADLGENLVAVVHLDFESRSVGKDEIVCTHSRVDGIDRSDTSFRSRNEASN